MDCKLESHLHGNDKQVDWLVWGGKTIISGLVNTVKGTAVQID